MYLYSFPGLKVHAKLCIVERMEKEKTQFYSYFGTGNFNEKTARIYCDYALLTKNQEMAKDAVKVFDYLIHKNDKQTFNHLLVAPFNMRQSFLQLIDNEIKNARQKVKVQA